MSEAFDELSKALAASISRREALRRAAGFLAASLAASLGLVGTASAASECQRFCGAAVAPGRRYQRRLASCMKLCKACGRRGDQICQDVVGGVSQCCSTAFETCCSDGCRDLHSDPEHCGACDHPCPLDLRGCCDGQCMDLQNDRDHC